MSEVLVAAGMLLGVGAVAMWVGFLLRPTKACVRCGARTWADLCDDCWRWRA